MMENSALQHAIFLADSAERFLEATNNLHIAQGEDGQGPDEIVDAELAQREAFIHLKSAIYEFRKRAEPGQTKVK
jgi:hypothetical protein